MRKRQISVLLAAMLTLVLCSCGQKEKTVTTVSTTSTTSAASAENTAAPETPENEVKPEDSEPVVITDLEMTQNEHTIFASMADLGVSAGEDGWLSGVETAGFDGTTKIDGHEVSLFGSISYSTWEDSLQAEETEHDPAAIVRKTMEMFGNSDGAAEVKLGEYSFTYDTGSLVNDAYEVKGLVQFCGAGEIDDELCVVMVSAEIPDGDTQTVAAAKETIVSWFKAIEIK